MRSTSTHRPAAAAATLILASALAHGAEISWDAGDGYYLGGSNWVGGVAPGADDGARFDLPTTSLVWFNSFVDTTSSYLRIDDGDWTLDLSGRTFDLSSTSGWPGLESISLNVDGGFPRLTVENGTMTGVHAEMSFDEVGDSIWTIGDDATVDLSGSLHVGVSGVAGMRLDGDVFVPETELGMFGGSNGTILVRQGGMLTLEGPAASRIGGNGEGEIDVRAGGTMSAAADLIVGESADGDGAIDVIGGTVDADAAVIIGQNGTGRMDVIEGGQADVASVTINQNPGADGTLRVDGEGSRCTIDGELAIHDGGVARIGDGAVLESNTTVQLYDSGDVSLEGGTLRAPGIEGPSGSIFFTANSASTLHITDSLTLSGDDAFATIGTTFWLFSEDTLLVDGGLSVTGPGGTEPGLSVFGGTATIAGNAVLGTLTNAQGRLSVTGDGASDGLATIDGTLYVGDLGVGHVEVNEGGMLKADYTQVRPGSSVEVFHQGRFETTNLFISGVLEQTGGAIFINNDSSIDASSIPADSLTGALVVDGRGPVSLWVTDGASLVAGAAGLGGGTDSTVHATVSGPGSTWTSYNLGMGSDDATSARLDVLDGGYVEVQSNIVVDANAVLNLDAGTVASELLIDGGRLIGTGEIIGRVQLLANGAIAPGSSAGLLLISGPGARLTTEPDSIIEIELGGTKMDEHDRIVVNGLVDLQGGTLMVEAIGGFDPEAGQVFEVISATGLNPNVDGELDAIEPADQFALVYTDDAVLIEVLGQRCSADLDGSGHVGFNDLALLLGAWGPCAGSCPQDLDGSGHVGFNDLALLLGSWGGCG